MAARHPNDTVALLHEGAADPASPRFVPVELRDDYARMPADVEAKLRRTIFQIGPGMSRSVAGRLTVIDPSRNDYDSETALVWLKSDWAALQVTGRRQEAEQAAYDRHTFLCLSCQEVRPSGVSSGDDVKVRRLCTGRAVRVCGRCFVLLDGLAREELSAERLADGRSRLDAARELLDALPNS